MNADDAPSSSKPTLASLPASSEEPPGRKEQAPPPEHILLLEALGRDNPPLEPPRTRRIFVNRNLTLEKIEVIGFDMDYTLALYNQPRLEALSVECTLKKMVESRGYPRALLGLDYNPQFAIRGLVVDCERGNLLKMDRYGYVGRAYHGTRALPRKERQQLYRELPGRPGRPRWAYIDTLFALPEAVLYARAIDYFDAEPDFQQLAPKARAARYSRLWNDIRECIDEAHRDDTLKSVIKADLASYIVKDPQLGETLHKFRSSGKKLFLLTNSLYDYTDAVMRYLLDGERKAYPSWRNYFDIVMVGAGKPAFFNELRPFVQIDPVTGAVMNGGEIRQLTRDKVYQAGNVVAFEQLTGIKGDQVLYIGDHIYGDILRLRKQHMWRTAMVLQELEREIAVSDRLEGQIKDLELLDRRHRNLESEIDYQSLRLKKIQRLLDEPTTAAALRARLEDERRITRGQLDALRDRADLMAAEVVGLEDRIDRAYNAHWGSCLREGNENSRFGEQVNDYADLYTSRVSNFGPYSPLRYFRAPRRPMPHEI